ncbi:MAG: LysE family translocator [Bacteriovoracaceae bacterium]|nr:LysE family translocator [Bacteriovoracaceae bacterium]
MFLSLLMTVIFGILLGIIICIPIGPINLITIKLTTKNRRSDALFLALGGSVMDIVYFLVFLLGLSFVQFSLKTTMVFKLLGISFIFLLGLIEVIKYFKIVKLSNDDSKKDLEAVESKASGFLSFISGVVIYTSNPTLVASMSGLAAFVKSSGFVPMTLPFMILFSFFAGVGTFLWFVFLTGLVVRYKNKFNDQFMLKLNLAFGVLIMIVAIVMATKLILA